MGRVSEGWAMLVASESVGGGKAKAERVVSLRERVLPLWWIAPRMDQGMMPGNFVMEGRMVSVLEVEQEVMDGVVTVVGGVASGMEGSRVGV